MQISIAKRRLVVIFLCMLLVGLTFSSRSADPYLSANASLNAHSRTIDASQVNRPMVDLRLTPSIQTIASGTAALFIIEVENTGNVALENIFLASEAVENCNKGKIAEEILPGQLLGPLTCIAPNVTERIDNIVAVEARSSAGGPVLSDVETAVIRIDNPYIQVDAYSVGQNATVPGDTAQFGFIVLNPSQQIALKDVQLRTFIRPLLNDSVRASDVGEPVEFPDCGFDIAQIDGGSFEELECVVPNVEGSFTLEVVARGRANPADQLVEDFDLVNQLVFDFRVDVEAEPSELLEGRETEVTFNVRLTNLSAVSLMLHSLRSLDVSNSTLHGDLLDPDNNFIRDNSCQALSNAPEIVGQGSTRSCSYTASVIGTGSAYVNVIEVLAGDNRGAQVVSRGESIQTIVESAFQSYVIYLPHILQWPPSFCISLAQESEPNNHGQSQANGPLCLPALVTGLPNDENDFYLIQFTRETDLEINLRGLDDLDRDVQLQLFNNASTLIAHDVIPPYIISKTVGPGSYFIRVVVAEEAQTSNRTYTLEVR